MRLGHLYRSSAVGGMDDNILASGKIIGCQKGVKGIELLPGVREVLLVGGGQMRIYPG